MRRLLALWLALLAPLVVHAVPAFTAVDLGYGVPLGVNNAGLILGLDSYTGAPPWVSNGSTKVWLPVPAGEAVTARRIGETGAVVGKVGNDAAVWWPKDGGGYTLDRLPFPPGATVGDAVDVNAGDVVLVSYATPVTLPTGLTVWTYKPWLYRRDGGLIDPAPASGALAEAVDLTDGGRILLRTGEIVEPGGTVTPAPAFPEPLPGGYHWLAFRATRISEEGSFVGVATLSSSMDYAQVARWSPVKGWRTLGGLSVNVSALGIDWPGNVLMMVNYLCPINFGLGYYASELDTTYCLDDLIVGGGWSFLSFASRGVQAGGVDPASAGGLVALGYSSAAGSYRLARLVPAGSLPLPPAVSLSATPHPATGQQPYTSITLRWTSAGSLAKAYLIERRDAGGAAFVEIARLPASYAQYDDTAIIPLANYDYRVAALALAGAGPYSNVATAQAPPPMDTAPPTVTINEPADGATVSGSVTVSATFTDNVGVAYARLSFSPSTSSGVLCSRAPSAPVATLTVSCKWDTRKVANKAPTATVTAFAQDAIGNWAARSVDVQVTYGGKGRRR